MRLAKASLIVDDDLTKCDSKIDAQGRYGMVTASTCKARYLLLHIQH